MNSPRLEFGHTAPFIPSAPTAGPSSIAKLSPPHFLRLITILLVALSVLSGCCTSPPPNDPNAVGHLRRLDHFAVHVRDLDVSAKFYKRVFGFDIVNKWKTVWMVGNDRIRVGLFLYPAAVPVADPSNALLIEHAAFLTDKQGFAQAIAKLDFLGIAHDPPGDTGIAKSVFLKDPDGHSLEITYYYSHVPKD